MLLLDEETDASVIDNDETALRIIGVACEDGVVLLVDGSDEFEGYLILEVDGEVGEEEDALLDDADVGLVDEVLLDEGVHIVEEFTLLNLLKGSRLLLVVLILDVSLHLLAQLT